MHLVFYESLFWIYADQNVGKTIDVMKYQMLFVQVIWGPGPG